MPRVSAGVLPYRRGSDGLVEVLLAHPGGPFWANRDLGAWSIAKGEVDDGEDLEGAARREFTEETGLTMDLPLDYLGSVTQKAGKEVHAFAVEADVDPTTLRSNTFTTEWPPKSGRMQEFPEVDRFEWFDLGTATEKINDAQAEFLGRLTQLLA